MSKAWTVSALNGYLKNVIESDGYLSNVILEGEISNFTAHVKGHWYFSVKDDASKISGVMWASAAKSNRYIPKDGAKVRITGRISVYLPGGQYQIYATSIQEAGIGDLFLEYEKRKRKLSELGWADASRKKQLPAFPMRIGVICGQDTAALADVKTTLQRRWPISLLTIYPSLVQGKTACYELEKRLKEADEDHHDVILLVRGGGSLEDLWSFNEWNVIQTIVDMKTPVVSGVGHEVDVTLVDYVSDKRAATPTAAAELVSPNREEIIQRILNLENRMIKDIRYRLDDENMRLVTNQKMMNNYVEKLQWKSQHVSSQKDYLLTKAQHLMTLYQNRVDVLKKRIELADQSERTEYYRKDIERYRNVLVNRVYDLLKKKETAFASEVQLLDAYSPLKVLSRGYAIASQNGKTLKHVSDINRTQNITLRLQDGTVNCKTVDEGDEYGTTNI